jgi:hypothetical protein
MVLKATTIFLLYRGVGEGRQLSAKKLFICLLSLTMLHGQILASFEVCPIHSVNITSIAIHLFRLSWLQFQGVLANSLPNFKVKHKVALLKINKEK